MEGVMDQMLYRLLIQVKHPETCLYAADLGISKLQDKRQSLQTWHHRLSHINHEAIHKMAKSNLVDGLQIIPSIEDTFYAGCIKGKQYRSSFLVNNPRERATVPGQIIHTDICGPIRVVTRTFSDGRSNDGRGGVRDLDAL
jgi:hypothetical protein